MSGPVFGRFGDRKLEIMGMGAEGMAPEGGSE